MPTLPAANNFFPSLRVRSFTLSCCVAVRTQEAEPGQLLKGLTRERQATETGGYTHHGRRIDVCDDDEVKLVEEGFLEEQRRVGFGRDGHARVERLYPWRRDLDALCEHVCTFSERSWTNNESAQRRAAPGRARRTFLPTSSSLAK